MSQFFRICFIITFIFVSQSIAFANSTHTQSQKNPATTKKVQSSLDEIVNSKTTSENEKKMNSQKIVQQDSSIVGLYKHNYLLPFYYTQHTADAVYVGYTPNHQALNHSEVKAQISLLLPVIRNILGIRNDHINFAYTQQMYWQVYVQSEYFREVNFEPEVFYRHRFKKNIWIDIGINHQSNGRGGELERSWNRAIVDLQLSYLNFTLGIKPWLIIFKKYSSDLHNPDIDRYMGNGEIYCVANFSKFSITSRFRNNLQSHFKRGSQEVTLSINLNKRYKFFVLAFHGYGQSLIEYNHSTGGVGVGFTIND